MPAYHHYNKKLKSFASQNRKESTKAEIRLWCELLRNKQLMGYSFLSKVGVPANLTVIYFWQTPSLHNTPAPHTAQ